MPLKIDVGGPIIRAALARLQDPVEGLGPRIAAFNAEPENAIDLDDPVEYVFGVTDVHVAYPTVEVLIPSGSLGNRSIGEAGQPGDQDHDPELYVLVWVEGVTGEARDLYERALGYVRVTIETLSVAGAFGVTAEVAQGPGAIRYQVQPVPDALADDGRTVAKWKTAAMTIFRLEAVETWH